MKFYIKTRSTEIDYNWIKVNNNSDSTEPKFKASESEFQKKLSDFEKTCFWAESSNQKSYLFFTGIPTNRKDKYNRPIRADLVVETDREENQNNEKLIGIVYSFIRSIKKQTKDTLPNTIENSFLSDFINKSLKKEDVDAYLLLTKEIEKLKRNNSNDNRIKEYEEKLKNINITIIH